MGTQKRESYQVNDGRDKIKHENYNCDLETLCQIHKSNSGVAREGGCPWGAHGVPWGAHGPPFN